MKITRISVYQVALPIPGGVYAISGGCSYSACDDTVVSVETDAGITGWDEVYALGANYLPVFGAGARVGGTRPRHLAAHEHAGGARRRLRPVGRRRASI
jgi:L-alanine-DL-glutamate epimerase-like enolase superfamily enzyme